MDIFVWVSRNTHVQHETHVQHTSAFYPRRKMPGSTSWGLERGGRGTTLATIISGCEHVFTVAVTLFGRTTRRGDCTFPLRCVHSGLGPVWTDLIIDKGCNQYQNIAIILEIHDIPRATSQYDIKFAPETPICNILVAPRDVEKHPKNAPLIHF